MLRLAHYSVKEFLVSERIREGPASLFAMMTDLANQRISEICLTCLLIFDRSSTTMGTSALDFSLLDYSAQYWYKHAHYVQSEPGQTILDSLIFQMLSPESPSARLKWLSIFEPDRDHDSVILTTPGSPLYYASYCGLLPLARRLLDLGEDVNLQTGIYGNALNAAAHVGNAAIVELLVEAGAQIEGRRVQHSSQERLMDFRKRCEATSKSRIDIFTTIRQFPQWYDSRESTLQALKGLDVVAMTLRKDYGYAMRLAASMGDKPSVLLLLDDKCSTQAHAADLRVACQEAAFAGHKDIVALLLTEGVDVNARGPPFGDAMQAAMSQNQYDIVEFLAKEGYQGQECTTALHQAAWSGYTMVVRYLLGKGADVEAQDPWHVTALHWAACFGHIETLEALLCRGANPDIQDCAGGSPLHFAAWAGQRAVIRLLLEHGADVDAKATFQYLRSNHKELKRRCTLGRTPLHEAAWTGRNEAICMLVAKGADLEAQDDHGWTALQKAALQGHTDTVRLLTSWACSENQTNNPRMKMEGMSFNV